jgi:polyhydroxyalkanoate synthesis regulator protein
MDWLKRSQDMINSWMETQQKMWKSFTDAAEMPDMASWDKLMKTWENSLKNFVESQALWARSWVRNASEQFDVPGADMFVKAVEEMTNTWTEMQQQLWRNWFEMMKNFDPSKMTPGFQEEATKAMQGWQDQMKKLLETQREWLNQWLSIGGDKK